MLHDMHGRSGNYRVGERARYSLHATIRMGPASCPPWLFNDLDGAIIVATIPRRYCKLSPWSATGLMRVLPFERDRPRKACVRTQIIASSRQIRLFCAAGMAFRDFPIVA